MATNNGTGRLLQRTTRDLRAPMAVLVAAHPQRRSIDHTGFDNARDIESLLIADLSEIRFTVAKGASAGIGSWAAAPVQSDGIEVGTLFVADRRRRWFDDDEVRHLGLLAVSATDLVAEFVQAKIEVDVRDHRTYAAALG